MSISVANHPVVHKPEIRLLSESDVDVFWRLRLRCLKEEPESFGSSYEDALNTPTAEKIKRLQNDDAFVLGAFMPNLIGMVGFLRREGLKIRHKGSIWGMYVAPEGRGQGIGKALKGLTVFAVDLRQRASRSLLLVPELYTIYSGDLLARTVWSMCK